MTGGGGACGGVTSGDDGAAAPGEDGGASLMVEEGVLENPRPTAIFGLHTSPDLTVGGTRVGCLGLARKDAAAGWRLTDPVGLLEVSCRAFQGLRKTPYSGI